MPLAHQYFKILLWAGDFQSSFNCGPEEGLASGLLVRKHLHNWIFCLYTVAVTILFRKEFPGVFVWHVLDDFIKEILWILHRKMSLRGWVS